MLLNRSIRSKVSLPPWLSSTEGVNQEQHRGWHRVVTLYATQLLNSLKCFPEPLCIHRVVNLSSTDSVVTVYAAQPLNSLKGFAPPLIEQHRGCQSRVIEQHRGCQSRACDSVLRHRSKLGIPCLVQEASSEFRAWSTVIAGFLYKQARNSELGPRSKLGIPSLVHSLCSPKNEGIFGI